VGDFGAEGNDLAKTKLSSYLQRRYGQDLFTFTDANYLKNLRESTWQSAYPSRFTVGDVVLVKGTAQKRSAVGGNEVLITAPVMKLALLEKVDVGEEEDITVGPLEKTGLDSVEASITLKKDAVYALPTNALQGNLCFRSHESCSSRTSSSSISISSPGISTSSGSVAQVTNAHSEPVKYGRYDCSILEAGCSEVTADANGKAGRELYAVLTTEALLRVEALTGENFLLKSISYDGPGPDSKLQFHEEILDGTSLAKESSTVQLGRSVSLGSLWADVCDQEVKEVIGFDYSEGSIYLHDPDKFFGNNATHIETTTVPKWEPRHIGDHPLTLSILKTYFKFEITVVKMLEFHRKFIRVRAR